MHVIFSIICLFLILPDGLQSQCDRQGLTPSENTSISYKHRGNRCEGFYRSQVSASSKPVELISCTFGDFRFRNHSDEFILLTIPTTNTQVNVRAQGIPSTLYYRMDAQLNQRQTLRWDVKEVLLLNQRTSQDHNIGVLSFSGEGVNKVFYPVKAQANLYKQEPSNDIVLKFMPMVSLTSFEWRLDRGPWNPVSSPGINGRPIKINLAAGLRTTRHTLEIKYLSRNSSEPETKRFTIKY